MKKIVLTFSMVAFVMFGLIAQVATSKATDKPTAEEHKKNEQLRQQEMQQKTQEQQNQNAQANNPNAPVVTFDKLVHDYGDIEQNGDGRCEFKFTNDGKEPLILSNVRSSCGCTVPEWPRQPILPGQSEIIKVKYDTKRVGVINKSISVYSNASQSPITLRIKGKVYAQSAAQLPEKNVDNSGSPVNK
ncbi:MAG: DUF1573 domain-containing protein [Bacteroidales bacterium]